MVIIPHAHFGRKRGSRVRSGGDTLGIGASRRMTPGAERSARHRCCGGSTDLLGATTGSIKDSGGRQFDLSWTHRPYDKVKMGG